MESNWKYIHKLFSLKCMCICLPTYLYVCVCIYIYIHVHKQREINIDIKQQISLKKMTQNQLSSL